MFEFAVLASVVVSNILVPMFRSGAEKLASSAGEQLGEAAEGAASSAMTQLWQRVRDVFVSPSEVGTLESFQRFPEAGAPMLQAMLEQKLRGDAVLVQDLERLSNARVAAGASLSQVINAAEANVVNAQGAHISGGIVAAKVVQPPQPSPEDRRWREL